VLQPRGRLVGYIIHTPDHLNAEDQERAAELGPSFVTASASPTELAQSAGFLVVHEEDVSTDFRSTAEALLHTRTELEEVLREEEGDDAYEEEQQKKRDMIEGIDAGLLVRSIIVAVKR